MKDVLSVIDANIHKYLPLELSPDDWSSLYIPYLNPSYTYNHLRYVLEERYAIGKVKTIHFVRNPSPSDKHKHDVSAFIHFEYWFNSDFALFLRYCLNQHEKYDISRYYKFFRFDARFNEDKNIPDRFHILINKSKNKHRGTTTYYPTQQPQVFDMLDGPTATTRGSWENTTVSPQNKHERHSEPQPEKEYIAKYSPVYTNSYSGSPPNPSTFMTDIIHLRETIEKHDRRIELLEEEITALRGLVQHKK